MAKLSQVQIKQLADEWAAAGDKIVKLEDKKNAELDPFLVKFNEKTKPIHEKHDPAIAKLREKQTEIAGQITSWLTAHGKPIVLEGEKAVAAVESKVGSRVISPETFFNAVKTKTADFWGCLKVEIAKAEKLLGKTEVDKISEKKTGLVPTLKLKAK